MNDSVTPYFAAKLINELFAEEGIDRKISPQQMYSAAKHNKIEIVSDENEKILVSLSSVAQYYKTIKNNKIGKKDLTNEKDLLRSMI